MITLLNIETSTTTCSASISINGKLIDEKIILSDKYVHGEQLHILIESLLKKNNISFTNLDGVCIASGPGSFTGLRIGVSTAKGIAFAIKKPLISVDTIHVMMENYDIPNKKSNSIYFPMIDARRDEVYTAGYNAKKEIVFPLNAKIIDQSFLDSLNQFENVHFIGSGARKFLDKTFEGSLINPVELNFSRGMTKITYNKFKRRDFEDVAYFVPLYLKDFKPF